MKLSTINIAIEGANEEIKVIWEKMEQLHTYKMNALDIANNHMFPEFISTDEDESICQAMKKQAKFWDKKIAELTPQRKALIEEIEYLQALLFHHADLQKNAKA
jgi:hypothetical protein